MSDKSEKTELQKNMEKALAMKRAAGEIAQIPEDQTADKGMQNNPNEKIAPSGALNAEGHKPVLSRSRGVRVSDKG
ncbi:MAG: hypothetical protein ACXIVE_15405 [Salinarimonas sp.]